MGHIQLSTLETGVWSKRIVVHGVHIGKIIMTKSQNVKFLEYFS